MRVFAAANEPCLSFRPGERTTVKLEGVRYGEKHSATPCLPAGLLLGNIAALASSWLVAVLTHTTQPLRYLSPRSQAMMRGVTPRASVVLTSAPRRSSAVARGTFFLCTASSNILMTIIQPASRVLAPRLRIFLLIWPHLYIPRSHRILVGDPLCVAGGLPGRQVPSPPRALLRYVTLQ